MEDERYYFQNPDEENNTGNQHTENDSSFTSEYTEPYRETEETEEAAGSAWPRTAGNIIFLERKRRRGKNPEGKEGPGEQPLCFLSRRRFWPAAYSPQYKACEGRGCLWNKPPFRELRPLKAEPRRSVKT